MAEQAPRRLTLTVTPAMAGEKIDTLLRRELHLSGTVIRRIKWLEDGILLDGVRAITGQRTAAGQALSVRVADPDHKGVMLPTPGPLDIVYEDGDLLVLNKAPGVTVHPGPGHYADTLCNFIAYYYRKQGITADVHPVQRLDRGTSGLMVVAKHPHAQERLKRQLHTPDFRRVYLAVCDGVPRPAQGAIDAPIGPAPGSRVAQAVRPDGKPAHTHYRVLRELGRIAFVSAPDLVNMDDATLKEGASADDLAAIASVKVKTIPGPMGDGFEREIRLADKLKALELIGKHLGMFTDKVELNAVEAVQIVDDIPDRPPDDQP